MSTKCRHSSRLGLDLCSDLPADRRENGEPCGSSGAGNAVPRVGGPDARANNVGRTSSRQIAENGFKMGQNPGELPAAPVDSPKPAKFPLPRHRALQATVSAS